MPPEEQLKHLGQYNTAEEEIETHVTTPLRPDTITCSTSGILSSIDVDRRRQTLPSGVVLDRYVRAYR